MAFTLPSRLRSFLRRKLEKARKCNAQTSTNTHRRREAEVAEAVGVVTTVKETTALQSVEPDVSEPLPELEPRLDEQHASSFFQKLPLEIRKMIYAYVWKGPYDHMYHESNGRHLHFKNGHWVHTRCVMYQEDDEDTDLIQKHMDAIQNTGVGNPLLWQRRLASTWGQRHWRCEERIEYGKPTSIDRTDLGALMVVCKRMHPEVMESFIECHKLIFNDVFSAHRFLASSGTGSNPGSSPLIRHIRQLDLTLSVPFHELASFIAIGHPDTDGHDDAVTVTVSESSRSSSSSSSSSRPSSSLSTYTTRAKDSRLGAIFAALASSPTCLHTLQISLDVYDRGPWRKLPERALATHLARIPVRRGKKGELNYTVDLPAALPIRTHYAGLEELSAAVVAGDGKEQGVTTTTTTTMLPFKVTRRPPLRYWQFNPGDVEHFTWETWQGKKRQQHCWIALSKAARPIPNPYLIDFAAR